MAQNTWTGRLRPSEKTSFDSLTPAPGALCCVANTDAPQETLVYFVYLNSGAANTVFRIQPWSPKSGSKAFVFARNDRGDAITAVQRDGIVNQVLRISKGVDKSLPCEDVVYGFEHDVRPLFAPTGPPGSTVARRVDAHLMDHRGVLLSTDVLEELFVQLNTANKSAVLPTPTGARWGILLPDMSPAPGSMTLEVKPKWLLQSPDAPADAIRCRTCALQASRHRDAKGYICPLRLVGRDQRDIVPWVRASIVAHYKGPPDAVDEVVSRLLEYITTGDGQFLLQHLKVLQATLDPVGVLCRDSATDKIAFDRNLRLAMTLRDCSWFVNVPYATGSNITSKLADLDFKSAAKLHDWAQKEEELVKGNWYTRKDVADYRCGLAQD
ncbi:hypothetical protein P153DRAFT_361437 [Dothidotthia symphoricarpi CBS 119687]|uniref:Inositol-pentakisphosphate 2-kinase n=1 Tax=Dothidotthia symphoricarpi CBS 119687 TaxID=1392245 RepID=A0A6A6A136_9PLEO|nr:uncharacterized protein P153DRAFT_361437 [Dothidotthia symphoricarpi CBS 119687]KAF2124271.1 hypothetical protein P153DRAFT_361437 [Dothidotthia symphoricarpi CBS 119687]